MIRIWLRRDCDPHTFDDFISNFHFKAIHLSWSIVTMNHGRKVNWFCVLQPYNLAARIFFSYKMTHLQRNFFWTWKRLKYCQKSCRWGMEGKNKPWISISDPGRQPGSLESRGNPWGRLVGQPVPSRRTETASRSEATLPSGHLLRMLS